MLRNAISISGLAAMKPSVLLLELEQMLGAANREPKRVDVDRLLVKIIGAKGDRPYRVFASLVSGGNDNLGGWCHLPNFAEGSKPFGSSVRIGRESEIDDCHRHRLSSYEIERLASRAGRMHLVVREGPPQLPQKHFVVLDDQ
jgi:hypothetical protein